MLRYQKIAAILLPLSLVGLYAAPASAVDDLVLDVPLASQSVDVGDVVTVTLYIASLLQPINGVQAFLQFDPAMLALINTSPNALAGDLASGWTVGKESLTSGNIVHIVGLLADSTISDGVVSTFTFTALSAGTTQITFDPLPPIPSKITAVDNSAILPTLTDSQSIVVNSGAAPPAIGAVDQFYAGKFLDAEDASHTCLAVGAAASTQNITNYVRGITGVRVRFTDIVVFTLAPIDAFSFEWTTGTGTTFTPITGSAGAVSVTAVDGGGVTTVDIVFDDDLIRRRWLKIVIDASQVSTGGLLLDGELQGNPLLLPSGDGSLGGDAVFFLGNMPGDVDGDGITLFSDAVQTRVQLNAFVPVPIDNVFDIDKSGLVLFSDAVQARVELNAFFTLPLIAP